MTPHETTGPESSDATAGDPGRDGDRAFLRACDETLGLLALRAPEATICPSEVARALAADWRGAMPAVHAAVDRLAADGLVRLSWKGETLATRTGPYRIGRPPRA